VRTAYRCRAYPDKAQQQVLARTFGCVRVVWNRTLATRQVRWHAEHKGTLTPRGRALLEEASPALLEGALSALRAKIVCNCCQGYGLVPAHLAGPASSRNWRRTSAPC
jgi:transposase